MARFMIAQTGIDNILIQIARNRVDEDRRDSANLISSALAKEARLKAGGPVDQGVFIHLSFHDDDADVHLSLPIPRRPGQEILGVVEVGEPGRPSEGVCVSSQVHAVVRGEESHITLAEMGQRIAQLVEVHRERAAGRG